MGRYKVQIKRGGNSKTSRNSRPIVTTARPADTCADTCIFKGLGIGHKPGQGGTSCYGSTRDNVMFNSAEAKGSTDTATEFKRLELEAQLADVDRLPNPPRTAVRHLEVGDIKDPDSGDDYIEQANAFHERNPTMPGWGYTHNHHNLDPASVQGWDLRASTETRADAADAIQRGWNPVIVSPVGDQLAGQTIMGRPVRTCPAELTPEIGCDKCTMCKNPHIIPEFPLHGNNSRINDSLVRNARHAQVGNTVHMGSAIPVGPPKGDDIALQNSQRGVTESARPDGDSTDADPASRNNGFVDGFSERNR